MPTIEPRSFVYCVRDNEGSSLTGSFYFSRYDDALKAAKGQAEVTRGRVEIERLRVANMRRHHLILALLNHEGWVSEAMVVAQVTPHFEEVDEEDLIWSENEQRLVRPIDRFTVKRLVPSLKHG